MTRVSPEDLLELFDHLALRVARALSGLDDWGLTGQRNTQYRHDVVADDIIRKALGEAGLGVLSEESGVTDPETAGDGSGPAITVVVDPIDGSTNASRGLPWYATSLCAVDAAGPLAALVVNLATGRRYRAIRGRGARRDGSPLVVGSSVALGKGDETGLRFDQAPPVSPSTCSQLSDAIVAFSGRPAADRGWRQFRSLGAAALDLCSVADGTLDGFVDADGALAVWDYLGALLVCAEAGVQLVDVEGRELTVLDPEARRGPMAGATPQLTEQLGSLVQVRR